MKTYVEGIGDVTTSDREKLREKWESGAMADPLGNFDGRWDNADALRDAFDDPFGALAGSVVDDLYSIDRKPFAPKIDPDRKPIGVTQRLITVRHPLFFYSFDLS